MGKGMDIRRPLAWQGTLAQMQASGTRLAQTCPSRDCGAWHPLDVENLIEAFGPEHRLWDRHPPCPACGARGYYMASPGPATPFRPLLSSADAHLRRQAFLRSFNFSRRDLVRIKALAESTTETYVPAVLNDLDVPVRVGACLPGQEFRSTGSYLGEWAGRTLLWWRMIGMELERWRSRRPGPRKL